jgi:large subunit ribosomal protein L23
MAEKNEILQTEKNKVVVLKVHPEAGKEQIKEAVERFFNVKVDTVRTMNYKGKEKRFGRIVGHRKDWKKAIVVLKEGEKLDFV